MRDDERWDGSWFDLWSETALARHRLLGHEVHQRGGAARTSRDGRYWVGWCITCAQRRAEPDAGVA